MNHINESNNSSEVWSEACFHKRLAFFPYSSDFISHNNKSINLKLRCFHSCAKNKNIKNNNKIKQTSKLQD